LLKANRFGDLRRSTLSWCRRTRISACNAARDRSSPIKAHQINLQRSLIGSEYQPIRGPGQPFWVRGRDRGNCSAHRNLSFNWKLILAPEFVLRYLVTHEAVHLAVPDHSPKFWLTVQSLCRETERAKQWLCAHGHELSIDLERILSSLTSFPARRQS
jgi:hypothetical protein